MKTQIIAEIGINHNGDIAIAKQLVDVAKSSGCDYVKFQKRDIESCYSQKELDSPRESKWGKTFRDQKEGLEFNYEEYREIDRYCAEREIPWFASPWDVKSVRFLEDFITPFIKVPSALMTDTDYLVSVRNTGKNVILSTGMCDIPIVDSALNTIGENVVCLMHCTSTYPSATEELNLRCIEYFKKNYQIPIGFSNHHPGLIFMPVAVALGATMLEFHITLDRSMPGSDQAASIEPEGVHKLVKWVRGVEQAMGDGRKCIFPREEPIIKKLRRVS